MIDSNNFDCSRSSKRYCCCRSQQKLNTYIDIYNDYKHHYFALQESYYTWYKEAGDLKNAVNRAFFGANGKIHSHQNNVGYENLAKAKKIALERLKNLSENDFNSFDAIHDFIKGVETNVKGFGILASYDVALRIAKYLNYEIKEVHLHRGVTIGAKAMGFNVGDGQTMNVDQFPHPFNQLSADHLENLLCIYKDDLASAKESERKY